MSSLHIFCLLLYSMIDTCLYAWNFWKMSNISMFMLFTQVFECLTGFVLNYWSILSKFSPLFLKDIIDCSHWCPFSLILQLILHVGKLKKRANTTGLTSRFCFLFWFHKPAYWCFFTPTMAFYKSKCISFQSQSSLLPPFQHYIKAYMHFVILVKWCSHRIPLIALDLC